MRTREINSKGIALVTVVLFFLVLVILLGGVMFSSVSNQRNAFVSKDHTAAYYVAESGINFTLEKLEKFLKDKNYENMTTDYSTAMIILDDYIMSEDTYKNSGLNNSVVTLTGGNQSGKFTINADRDLTNNKYIISSVGEVNDISRKLIFEFSFEENEKDLMKTVYVKDTLTLKSMSIVGDIASLTGNLVLDKNVLCGIDRIYIPNTVSLPLKDDKGNILPLSRGACTPTKPDIKVILFNNSGINFEPIRIDDFYPGQPNTDGLTESEKEELLKNTITLKPNNSELKTLMKETSGSHIGEYTFPVLGTNQKAYSLSSFTGDLTFYLGEDSLTTHKVFLSDTVIHNGSIQKKITVKGKGKLQLFITLDNKNDTDKGILKIDLGTFVDGKNQTNTGPDLSQFQLIINTSSDLDYSTIEFPSSAANTYMGSIIADKLNFTFGNAKIKGFIGTNGLKVDVSSNTEIEGPMWIYAPYADFTSKAASLKGSIISKTADLKTGAGQIIYEPFGSDIPGDMHLPLFEAGSPIKVGIIYEFINFKED